jgi:hypothetical protein
VNDVAAVFFLLHVSCLQERLIGRNQKPNGVDPTGYRRLVAMLVEKKETRKARPATVIHKHVFICAPDVVRRPFIRIEK